MTMNCERCNAVIKTGKDDIKQEDNEYTHIEISLHMSGGYKSRMVEDKSYEYSELCPTCSKELLDKLDHFTMDFIYKKGEK